MKPYLLPVLCLCSVFSAQAIVIRHDKADELYIYRTAPIPALVSFTTVHDGKPYVVGSGTYLGDGWVLTAAHVAHFLKDTNVAEINTERLNIDTVVVHEKWRDQQIGYDIALVKVSEPAKKIALVSLFSYQVKDNDIITIAGLGDSGNGLIGITSSDFKPRVAENRVDTVKEQWLKLTFNSPENGALEFEGISGGGDSGAPAYIIQNGITHIVGISSWQDTEPTNWQQGLYGAIDYYTNVNFYQQWLLQHLPASTRALQTTR